MGNPLLLQQTRMRRVRQQQVIGRFERNLKKMPGLARILVRLGLLLIVAGLVVYVLGRLGVSLGRLPGDFAWRRKNVSVYFPLGTSILLSVLLTLVLFLISLFRR